MADNRNKPERGLPVDGISRRELFRGAALAAGTGLAGTVSCSGGGVRPRELKRKVIILGFDAVDPVLLEQFMLAGELPNLRKLSREGSYREIASSIPPESPVAWSTFSVSAQAGVHGVFDFLNRDPATYTPIYASVRPVHPKFLWDMIPISRPGAICLRSGKPFWEQASENGIKTAVLEAPVAFPAARLESDSMLLTGLDTPDLRGTQATYHFFTTDIYSESGAETEFGGKVSAIEFGPDGRAGATIFGPWNPITRRKRIRLLELRNRAHDRGDLASLDQLDHELDRLQEADQLTTPIAFRVDRAAGRVTVEVCGRAVSLSPGNWSDWVEIEFQLNFLVRLRGFCRFILTEMGDEVKVFMSPVEIHPEDPVLPISWPADFAGRLVRSIGLFKVRGWAAETAALKEQKINERAFMQDLHMIFDQRRAMGLEVLEKERPNLFFELFSDTDRVQHMFWRLVDKDHPMYDPDLDREFGDAILSIYRRMDSFVGEVRERFEDPDTLLFVVSDHGFSSFRKGVNINTWLVENGYMRLQGQDDPRYNLKDLFGGGDFFRNVDWQGTQAYSLGLGLIYINLRGREGQGIVEPGDEYARLVREIAGGLTGMTDPEDGVRVVNRVYAGQEVYRGARLDEAPDLVVGFSRNYRVSWQTALGGIPSRVIEPNMEKWSGDHCSVDRDLVPGVLLCNRKVVSETPDLRDVAPTALNWLGCPVPDEYEGRDLFET